MSIQYRCMCGRFTLVRLSEFTDLFPWIRGPDSPPPARYNIAPSQPIAVVANKQDPGIDFFQWGLVPSWAKDVSIGNRMINARAETVGEKPAFRTALRRRRCLIPANGFFEWKKHPDGTKTPMYIRMKSGRPFAFAGLWEQWHAPDGSVLPSCTIITTEANNLVRDIHDRMPVILNESDFKTWLNPSECPSEDLEKLLAPYPAAEMEAFAVSKAVNNPRNDSRDCIDAGRAGSRSGKNQFKEAQIDPVRRRYSTPVSNIVMIQTDVIIIGGGPMGIELAVALKRQGIVYLHFEAKQVGQTMFWWPPQTRWFSSNDRISIAGVPLQTVDQMKATREDYLRYLRSIVQQFDLRICTFEPVVRIEPVDGGFIVHTRPAAGERSYRSKYVVLATGGTAQPRKLGVRGEGLPHVSHYVEDPHKYFRRRVLIVGGRNSAVEAALRIHQVGAEVTISYRRGEFNARSIKYWLYPEITGLIKEGKIKDYFNTVVTEITPAEVELAPSSGEPPQPGAGGHFRLPADVVLLLVGYVADMSLARMAGVELRDENEVPVFDETTMQTNVPGLFISGTATGGTQDRYRIFLENCHIHIDRIVAAIMGAAPPPTPQPLAQPES